MSRSIRRDQVRKLAKACINSKESDIKIELHKGAIPYFKREIAKYGARK